MDTGPARESDGEPAGRQQAAGGKTRLIDALSLHDSSGHLLRRAQQRAIDIFMQAFADHGLRPPQFALLLAAYQNPDANQSDLVRETGIDRSTAADMITRLATRGLIERVRTKTDGRANRLKVTAAGIEALESAAAAAQSVHDSIMAPIAPGQRDRFLKQLRQITDLEDHPRTR